MREAILRDRIATLEAMIALVRWLLTALESQRDAAVRELEPLHDVTQALEPLTGVEVRRTL